MAFYDIFERLCKEKGVSPTQAGRDNDIQQGVVSMWKKRGSTPKAETLLRLSRYFNVSPTVFAEDGVHFADGSGYGGGSGSGAGFEDGTGCGGPMDAEPIITYKGKLLEDLSASELLDAEAHFSDYIAEHLLQIGITDGQITFGQRGKTTNVGKSTIAGEGLVVSDLEPEEIAKITQTIETVGKALIEQLRAKRTIPQDIAGDDESGQK